MTKVSCPDSSLSGADKVLLESIIEYYNNHPDVIKKFISIVKRKNGMSLRVIDYLCTNFSKEHSIVIGTKDGHIPRDLNSDYQKNLNAYNKKYLDPFSRRHKIVITVSYENGLSEERASSIGQMNFFRWFFNNNIDQYLSSEKNKIEAHMKKSENESRKNKKRKAVKMYTPRSYTGKFVMNFD